MAARQHRWIAQDDPAGVTAHLRQHDPAEPEDPRLAGVFVLVTRGLATRTDRTRQSRTATAEGSSRSYRRRCGSGSAARSTVLQGGVSTVGWIRRAGTKVAWLEGAAAHVPGGEMRMPESPEGGAWASKDGRPGAGRDGRWRRPTEGVCVTARPTWGGRLLQGPGGDPCSTKQAR